MASLQFSNRKPALNFTACKEFHLTALIIFYKTWLYYILHMSPSPSFFLCISFLVCALQVIIVLISYYCENGDLLYVEHLEEYQVHRRYSVKCYLLILFPSYLWLLYITLTSNVENRLEGIKTGKKEIHWRHNQGKKKQVGNRKQEYVGKQCILVWTC